VSLARPPDARSADWVVAGLRGFAESVLSFVPSGFDAYVQVFHPARRDGARVTWAEIAALMGRSVDQSTMFDELIRSPDPYNYTPQPGVFDEGPERGAFPRELVDLLIGLLGRHTRTPDRCWFAVWEGWGAMQEYVASAPRFEVPGRAYHVLTGTLRDATETVSRWGAWQSANLWWPDDRAWCVGTEIDLEFTYIGCDAACRDELLAAPELEAIVADPSRPWREGVSDTRGV